jgi:hypothetical protein
MDAANYLTLTFGSATMFHCKLSWIGTKPNLRSIVFYVRRILCREQELG